MSFVIKNVPSLCDIVYILTGRDLFDPFGRGGAVKSWRHRGVCRAIHGFARVCLTQKCHFLFWENKSANTGDQKKNFTTNKSNFPPELDQVFLSPFAWLRRCGYYASLGTNISWSHFISLVLLLLSSHNNLYVTHLDKALQPNWEQTHPVLTQPLDKIKCICNPRLYFWFWYVLRKSQIMSIRRIPSFKRLGIAEFQRLFRKILNHLVAILLVEQPRLNKSPLSRTFG